MLSTEGDVVTHSALDAELSSPQSAALHIHKQTMGNVESEYFVEHGIREPHMLEGNPDIVEIARTNGAHDSAGQMDLDTGAHDLQLQLDSPPALGQAMQPKMNNNHFQPEEKASLPSGIAHSADAMKDFEETDKATPPLRDGRVKEEPALKAESDQQEAVPAPQRAGGMPGSAAELGYQRSLDPSAWLDDKGKWFSPSMKPRALLESKRAILWHQKNQVARQIQELMTLTKKFQDVKKRCPISGRTDVFHKKLETLFGPLEGFTWDVRQVAMKDLVPLIPSAKHKHDRLSLLAILEGGKDKAEKRVWLETLIDEGGLKGLTEWLSDADADIIKATLDLLLLPLSVAGRATAVAESKFFKTMKEVLKRGDMAKHDSLDRKRQKLVDKWKAEMALADGKVKSEKKEEKPKEKKREADKEKDKEKEKRRKEAESSKPKPNNSFGRLFGGDAKKKPVAPGPAPSTLRSVSLAPTPLMEDVDDDGASEKKSEGEDKRKDRRTLPLPDMITIKRSESSEPSPKASASPAAASPAAPPAAPSAASSSAAAKRPLEPIKPLPTAHDAADAGAKRRKVSGKKSLSWAPDDELEKIKYFNFNPEEWGKAATDQVGHLNHSEFVNKARQEMKQENAKHHLLNGIDEDDAPPQSKEVRRDPEMARRARSVTAEVPWSAPRMLDLQDTFKPNQHRIPQPGEEHTYPTAEQQEQAKRNMSVFPHPVYDSLASIPDNPVELDPANIPRLPGPEEEAHIVIPLQQVTAAAPVPDPMPAYPQPQQSVGGGGGYGGSHDMGGMMGQGSGGGGMWNQGHQPSASANILEGLLAQSGMRGQDPGGMVPQGGMGRGPGPQHGPPHGMGMMGGGGGQWGGGGGPPPDHVMRMMGGAPHGGGGWGADGRGQYDAHVAPGQGQWNDPQQGWRPPGPPANGPPPRW